MPTFAMTHSGGRHTVKLVGAFEHGGDQAQRIGVGIPPAGLSHLVIQTVQALPHLRTDLLPNLAGILAAFRDAGHDGRFVVGIAGERDHSQLWVYAAVGGGDTQRRHDALPSLFGGELGRIQHQVIVRLKYPRAVIGPLKITAHPVKAIGYAGEHFATPVFSSAVPMYPWTPPLARN